MRYRRILSVAAFLLTLSATPLAVAEHRSDPSPYGDRDRYDDRYERGDRYGRSDRLSDRAIHDRVHAALERRLGYQARGISVVVRNQDVFLSGTVRSQRARRAAHDIAHSVYGVNSVYHGELYVDRY